MVRAGLPTAPALPDNTGPLARPLQVAVRTAGRMWVPALRLCPAGSRSSWYTRTGHSGAAETAKALLAVWSQQDALSGTPGRVVELDTALSTRRRNSRLGSAHHGSTPSTTVQRRRSGVARPLSGRHERAAPPKRQPAEGCRPFSHRPNGRALGRGAGRCLLVEHGIARGSCDARSRRNVIRCRLGSMKARLQ